MDEREHGDEHTIPGSRAGDQVGLGRVVEDRREATGHPDAGDPGESGTTVEEASAMSFPASDPPPFMSEPATPADPDRDAGVDADRDAIRAPSPDEVP